MADREMELACDHCGRTKSIDSHGSMIGEACHHCGRGYWRVRPSVDPSRPARDGETLPEWGMPVRYLTDDRDLRDRHELVVLQGGNGDWYVSVLPEGHRLGPTVRICTSGGAAAPPSPEHDTDPVDHSAARDGEALSDERVAELSAMIRIAQARGDWWPYRDTMLKLCDTVAALRAGVAALRRQQNEVVKACDTGLRLSLPAEQIVARIRAARSASGEDATHA